MDRNDFIKRMEMTVEAAKMLPADLEPSHIWLEGNDDQRTPQLMVYESIYTKPDRFYAYADRLGKTVERASCTETSDVLLMDLDNGVQICIVVDKEETDESA